MLEDTRGRSRSRSPHRQQTRARSSSFSDFSSKSPERRHPPPDAPECKIFVDRLTRNVHEGHIREIFGAYGHVRTVKHHRQRGWAHVEYDEGEAARRAIHGMDGGQIDGSVIRVSIYRHNPRHAYSRDRDRYRR